MDYLLLQVRTLYFCIFVHASQYYRPGGLKSSNSVGDPHVERKITKVATASNINTYGLSPWLNKVLQKCINRGVQKIQTSRI